MRQLAPGFADLLYQGWRRPAYRLLAFDPAQDNLTAVVTGAATQTPFDLTPYCTDISWSPAQLSFTLADPQQIFHPDKGDSRQYLADGAIIRLREGDARVSESDWLNTFTGYIKGQIGWENNRSGGVLEAKITVFSRDNSQSLKRRLITTPADTVGTDVGLPLSDIAQRYIGMSAGELRVPQALGLQLKNQITQFCQVAPWDAITTILEAVGQAPFIDGDGRLGAWSKDMHRAPNRVLSDQQYIFDDQIPARTQDNINYIRVTFLDSQLTQVVSAYQKLGSAQVTTGFFTPQEKLKCWWSDDHTQRAQGTQLKIIKSVNSGLLPVGKESYRQEDDFHGEITIAIEKWVPVLATLMVAEYLAVALIPDHTAPGQNVIGTCAVAPGPVIGITDSPGLTIPWGRVLQAQSSIVIMLIMMSLGSAQYEIWGYPFDYAYLEQHTDAIESPLDGNGNPQPIPYYAQNKREIKNDLIGSYNQADAIAMLELTWEKSNSYPRRLLLEDDPSLEVGDILELPDGRKFMIQDLSKTIKRGDTPVLTADCIKVMTA
jgi:hypothetical protein